MTAILPETTVGLAHTLADLPDATPDVQAVIGAGLIRALGLTGPDPDYIESIETGLTESYADYCTRMQASERSA